MGHRPKPRTLFWKKRGKKHFLPADTPLTPFARYPPAFSFLKKDFCFSFTFLIYGSQTQRNIQNQVLLPRFSPKEKRAAVSRFNFREQARENNKFYLSRKQARFRAINASTKTQIATQTPI